MAMSLGWGSEADIPICRYRVRVIQRVFGADAPTKGLCKPELCGGVCGGGTVWGGKNGGVLRLSET